MVEKKTAMDRIVIDGINGKRALVIACHRAEFTHPVPGTNLTHCKNCEESIVAFDASIAKQKEGYILLCRECVAVLAVRFRVLGKKTAILGRVVNNKFPEYQ